MNPLDFFYFPSEVSKINIVFPGKFTFPFCNNENKNFNIFSSPRKVFWHIIHHSSVFLRHIKNHFESLLLVVHNTWEDGRHRFSIDVHMLMLSEISAFIPVEFKVKSFDVIIRYSGKNSSWVISWFHLPQKFYEGTVLIWY